MTERSWVIAPIQRSTVGLISCGKRKLDRPAPARDLYTGRLFQLARQFAERHCERWYILSAKHGLVSPETVLEPYDLCLNDLSVRDVRAWAKRVYEQLAPDLTEDTRVLIHGGRHPLTVTALAGNAYLRWLVPLFGWSLWRPLLGLGIGQQLLWLKTALEGEQSVTASRNPVAIDHGLHDRRKRKAKASEQADLFGPPEGSK
jgi:hypothetical protein